jgi:hypothetical protein
MVLQYKRPSCVELGRVAVGKVLGEKTVWYRVAFCDKVTKCVVSVVNPDSIIPMVSPRAVRW